MAVLPRVIFFIAVVLFNFSEAQNEFAKLAESYKKGVRLAETQVNSHNGVQHHFLFFKSLSQSSIEAGFNVNYFYHHFHLKATKCSRGTENADPKKCVFRNDRPVIDCAICYKMFDGEIQMEPKPYIHCIHKPMLTKEMELSRIEHCNSMSFSNGAMTLLASTGSE
ncbi:hypothetical protein PHYPO_G00128710 [Pangasianodon hypophthalmus]|uniref:Retinoic acid receptor responder protein 2 n=1 Tax=Pangasianodon hypophthalmus TaxID=310915 RepID=A0A5N5KSP3_PANHP|nr:hypothetical protein PHYPO_G00128710 [Pangasianodon hypophthalmus]